MEERGVELGDDICKSGISWHLNILVILFFLSAIGWKARKTREGSYILASYRLEAGRGEEEYMTGKDKKGIWKTRSEDKYKTS